MSLETENNRLRDDIRNSVTKKDSRGKKIFTYIDMLVYWEYIGYLYIRLFRSRFIHVHMCGFCYLIKI